jgi:hypothetical protein
VILSVLFVILSVLGFVATPSVQLTQAYFKI